MKQREISAHSSGRSGGDSRVFDFPAMGVLQIIAAATGFMLLSSYAAASARIKSK